MKLNLGCGSEHKKGYLNIDLYCPVADLIHDLSQPLPFKDESIDKIYASHVIEHLSRAEWQKAKQDWARVLKKGGKLEILCPDLEYCMLNFLRNYHGKKWEYWIKTIYGSQEAEGEFHRNGFTLEKLKEDLTAEGFTFPKHDHFDPTEISLVCFK